MCSESAVDRRTPTKFHHKSGLEEEKEAQKSCESEDTIYRWSIIYIVRVGNEFQW